jgi:peptidoglycan/xylan/chitin deacetylase (PgdA/CDA1 family)
MKITRRQLRQIIKEATGGKGWTLGDGSCNTHNISPNDAAEAIAVLQEFGYELGIPITVDSNNIAIDDALAAYPGEFTYEDFKCAVQVTQGRGA